jgi:MoxR-like ATPase
MKTTILVAALFTPASKGRWGLPILTWSNPGEGKTSVIEEVCAQADLPCVTLSPGEMGEGAFGVIPVPDGKFIRYPAPEWVEKVADGGVVFIDEMSSTPPALQPPLLGLLFAGRIGGTVLHPRVRRIGAANPPEVAAGGFELAPPVANRCGHIDWAAPTVQERAAYMMRGSTGDREAAKATSSATEREAKVLEAWPNAWATAVGLETAFLAARPHLKNQCPKVGDKSAGRAWPSDRSWEAATRALASSQVHGLSEAERDEFIAAFIGEAVASEFTHFITEADLPNPALLLDGKAKFTHTSARLDRTAAVLASCVSLVTPKDAQRRNERAASLWELINSLVAAKTDLDVLIPAVSSLLDAALVKGPSTATLAKLQPVIELSKAGGR